ncbi:hypothetical protein BJY52DRAFT_402255 [Lactarius psammicola]|nr:hypothetical protein BJY52DRAFT_402255 [Lactarius psammicola]
MAGHQVSSQHANHISANIPHQSHGHVQRNPHVAGDDQQDVYWGGVPQPVGNVVTQGETQYPRHIGAPNYNAAHYHPPPPLYPEVPHVHMHWDVGVAEAVPPQAHPFAPLVQEVQENYDGLFSYGAQFPAAGPPEALPGVWLHPAPPANIPPANDLRNLAGRYLNNPDTRVKTLRIDPGPGGRFEVWIALELADIF